MRRILIVKKKLELSKLVDKKIGDNDDNEKCRSTFFFFSPLSPCRLHTKITLAWSLT